MNIDNGTFYFQSDHFFDKIRICVEIDVMYRNTKCDVSTQLPLHTQVVKVPSKKTKDSTLKSLSFTLLSVLLHALQASGQLINKACSHTDWITRALLY